MTDTDQTETLAERISRQLDEKAQALNADAHQRETEALKRETERQATLSGSFRAMVQGDPQPEAEAAEEVAE